MSRALVTGGAGFVGRHLCHALLERGDEVVCVDNIVPLTGGIAPEERGWPLYDPRSYRSFSYVRQDCRDFFRASEAEHFDEVYHLAAIVGGREMIERNPLAVADDLSIDSSFWQWARQTNPGKVICFSSSAAYPVRYQRHDGYRLLTEDMIDFTKDLGVPDLSYGWSKLTHEYLARLAFERHGVRSVTYRPFSGYGEDQDMTYPFPSICRRAIEERDKRVLQVWGSGDQMRDFIHISDCITGILLTKDAINDGAAINLSTGILTSFKQFATTAADIVGYAPSIVGTSDKPEGVFARGGDTTLQTALGFSKRMPFNEGIVRCIDYLTSSGRV